MIEYDKFQGFHKFQCLRFHKETEEHLRAKFEKCVELWKLGHKFGTEIKLSNGKIADVVDFTDNQIYEFERGKSDKKRGKRIQI